MSHVSYACSFSIISSSEYDQRVAFEFGSSLPAHTHKILSLGTEIAAVAAAAVEQIRARQLNFTVCGLCRGAYNIIIIYYIVLSRLASDFVAAACDIVNVVGVEKGSQPYSVPASHIQ